jgi:TPP-dependent pyruvate/acetoin dehydrogenase alpha subunit
MEISSAEAAEMVRLRHSMHLLNEMLKAGRFKIPIHLGFGYEAAAVAMDRTLGPDDVLCLTHRNAAYNLARCKSLETVIAHYSLEQPAGGAQMASMNLVVEGTGIAYSSSILGNNLAVACGIAMNRRLLGRPGVVFACTGDGAIEEGVFWETLLFARSHALKLVIVVENNDHSMSSTIAERRSPIDLSLVCAGVGATYRHAAGARLADVKAALASARADAESEQLTMVELDLRCFNHHAGPTPGWSTDTRRIALADGLLMGDDDREPLVVLRQEIGVDRLEQLVEQVMMVSPVV